MRGKGRMVERKSTAPEADRSLPFPRREFDAKQGNRKCRFARIFTGATGLEPATSGVTVCPNRFSGFRLAAEPARSCGFRQVRQARVFRLVAPGRVTVQVGAS